MTSTTEIVNDTTSVQSRIDTVLGSVDRELDWGNDSGWQPGDPLYAEPNPFAGGQFVRPMIQLLTETNGHDQLIIPCDCGCERGFSERHWSPTCLDCEVSWVGPEPCWSCGAPRPATVSIDITDEPYLDRVEAAFREAASRAMARTSAQVLERARDRFVDLNAPSRVVVGFDGSRDTDAVVFTAAPGRMWLLPNVANPSAPTMAELTSEMAVDAGLQLDGYQRAWLDAWFPESAPFDTHTSRAWPSRLPIDGHAYRRRTKRRRRR